MKNNKGFTLIELMIAIAIIGILALVLIPKVGTMKSQAKLAGMDTNLRLGQSVVEGLITDVQLTGVVLTDETTLQTFETALKDRLGAGGADKQIVNPITKAGGVSTLDVTTAAGVVAAPAAFAYATGGEGVDATVPTDPAPAVKDTLKGVIVFNAYRVGNAAKVRLVPYDDNGNVMTTKIRTVEQ